MTVLALLVLAAPPVYLPPAPAATLVQPVVYRIRRRDGGGYIYDADVFDALIARDGTVSFRDDHGMLNLLLPIAAPQRLPPGTPTLEGSIKQVLARPGTAVATAATGATTGTRPRVVLEICESKSCVDPERLTTLLGATFDISDEISRLAGDDPYRAQKAGFLRATADWRLGLTRAQRDREAQAALASQERQLQAIWSNRRYTPAERRHLLFNLWLEMDRDSPDGRRGADGVIWFIRRKLPAGSQAAFTPEELRVMNAAAAPLLFAPYQ
jgi:hypothetical protein